MAPDRGTGSPEPSHSAQPLESGDELGQTPEGQHQHHHHRSASFARAERRLAAASAQDTNFTARGVLVGTAIGVLICFSNTYFGLQTGWVSGLAMPAALLGFAWFRAVARCIAYPFTPVENVLVQTVAGAAGTMPLGAGLVGVMPALNFLLEEGEGGRITLGFGKLVVWSVGICFFGVFVAVPLRKEFLIRERLRFPSGTATALMIKVLHEKGEGAEDDPGKLLAEERRLMGDEDHEQENIAEAETVVDDGTPKNMDDWRSRIRLLIVAFCVSALYTVFSYFVPQVRGLPIFGTHLADKWVWSLNPSPAYVGQGIIMGPTVTAHMLFGAILGWAILSPIAKGNGWAPGPVDDWNTGSKGWIVWVSLAIMIADSVVNIGWLVLRPAKDFASRHGIPFLSRHSTSPISGGIYRSLTGNRRRRSSNTSSTSSSSHADSEPDAPPEHQPSAKVVYGGFALSLVVCIIAVHFSFPGIIPFHGTLLALVLSLLLSLVGTRAIGETDLNPVSGISKITQLVFALLFPPSAYPLSTPLNLVAGALSESAALQAGDMMQDLKAGHLVGASPKAQFYGQLIGSAVGSVVAAGVYALYTRVYTVPSKLFQVPTAYVWVFTARLVTGDGLPPRAAFVGGIVGIIWVAITAVRVWARPTDGKTSEGRTAALKSFVYNALPGGIAVAVGMYNVPSFTLARAVGGLVNYWWVRHKGREETRVVVLASGLILGEGVASIVNLGLASLDVVHL